MLAPIGHLFGAAAGVPLAYYEWGWGQDPLTSVLGNEQQPASVPLQGPRCCGTEAGKLHWAGTQTTASEWERLDGAVESSRHGAAQVLR